MNCPRRLGEIGPWDHEETDQDSWREDSTCSFCGGLQPEIFFHWVKRNAKITTTDKKYKLYIETGTNSMQKVYLQHFSEDQLTVLQEFMR